MKLKLLFFVFSIVFLSSCSNSGPKYTLETLPSGRQVKIVGMYSTYLAQSNEQALTVTYLTDISFDNIAELRKEINEVWEAFKINVEKVNLKVAIIGAQEPPKGAFITKNRVYNFIFRQGEDGQWRSVE